MAEPMKRRDTDLVTALFDELVPPREDQNLAGAGRPEIVAYVQEKMDAAPELAMLIDGGLAAIQEQALQQHGEAFRSLPGEQRAEVVRTVEAAQPFFLPILLLHVYGSYYQQCDVLEANGYPARPLFPEGHDLESDDEAILNRLRERVGRP
jgi:hypothetical protein